MTQQIYAVYDKVAQSIIGGLMCFSHDAPVVRIFTDGLADPSTTLNKHPDDFELVCLGEITDTEISGYVTGPRLVLSGSAWRSMQQSEAEVAAR